MKMMERTETLTREQARRPGGKRFNDSDYGTPPASSSSSCAQQEDEQMIGGSPAVFAKFAFIVSLPQPIHLIVLVAVVYLGFVLIPREHLRSTFDPSALSTLLYLGCFASHFGAQMWMTFVSGIILYFRIPRHTFATVQRQLFPNYFLLNTVLSFVTLATFVRNQATHLQLTIQTAQLWVLLLCFLIELGTRLYIVPPLLETMQARLLIEAEAGIGGEIGHHDPGRLGQCPHYMSVHQRFRRLHCACAVANLAAVACSASHLHHLATKLCSLN